MSELTDPDSPNHRSFGHRALPAVILVIVTLAVLWPLVNQTRIWDDDRAIFRNPHLNPPRLSALRQVWLHPQQSQYNPITHTLWWMIAHIAAEHTLEGLRLDPVPFHAANLLVHVLSALAVFSILRRLVKANWPAWAGAMLFAIHPVQVETVAWIFGMRDLLVGLLCLVALHQYLAAATLPEGKRWRYALAVVAFAAAILSKGTAVVLPGMMVILDFTVLRRPMRTVMLSVAPFVILSIPCVLWMPFIQPAAEVPSVVPWRFRPLVATDALAFYLWKLAWPFELAVDYGRTPRHALERGWIWWTWVAPVALAAVLYLVRHRAAPVIAGAGVFVAGLLPVLGIKRFDFQGFSTVADHYLYLPMLGVSLAVVAILLYVCGKPRAQPWAWTLVTLVLVALAWRAADQTRYWRSARELWQHTAAVNPRSWSAWNSLATLALAENRAVDAESLARRALDAGGDYWVVHLNLGNALERQGRIEQALREFEWIVINRPDLPNAHIILAGGLERARRLDEAIRQLDAALNLNPANSEAQRLRDALVAQRVNLKRP